jgi:hypothetical protein
MRLTEAIGDAELTRFDFTLLLLLFFSDTLILLKDLVMVLCCFHEDGLLFQPPCVAELVYVQVYMFRCADANQHRHQGTTASSFMLVA